MDPRLQKLVENVRAEIARPNPAGAGGSEIDPGTLLQVGILRAGLKDSLVEGDVLRALDEIGVPEDDQVAWLEEMASWV